MTEGRDRVTLPTYIDQLKAERDAAIASAEKAERVLYEVSSHAESDRAEAYIMLKDNNEALGLKLIETENERDEARRQRDRVAAALRNAIRWMVDYRSLGDVPAEQVDHEIGEDLAKARAILAELGYK